MNTHIDQLAQWYADAERITVTNLPRIGDTLIFPYNACGYAIEVEDDDWTPNIVMPGEVDRILHRAPKPKPAWRDAVAVIAHTKGWGRRRVFTRYEGGSTNGNRIWSCGNLNYGSDDLIDPAPLIEAKVTDEARERVWKFIQKYTGEDDLNRPDYDAEIDGYITAALGLETT